MDCCDNSRSGRRTRRSSTNSSSGTSKHRHCISIFLTCLCIGIIVFLSLLLTFYIFYLESSAPEDENSVCNNDPSFYKSEEELPLILTPWIKNGKIKEAQALAKVRSLKGVGSYSGYLTVNQTFNSNLFFWFFPALSGSKNQGSVTMKQN